MATHRWISYRLTIRSEDLLKITASAILFKIDDADEKSFALISGENIFVAITTLIE